MPLNVRRLGSSILFTLTGSAMFVAAQTTGTPAPVPAPSPAAATTIAPPAKSPTSAEVMRERISKAKAYIVVRNYNAAIYELENIRRETTDPSAQSVTSVLLMHSYLEQGDYKRAQAFLSESFAAQKANKPNSPAQYAAVAGQIVSGARNKIERYRSLGLNVADRTLPLEASNDLERMRETLEMVITQAKELSGDGDKTKAARALPVLEEAASSRAAIARDDYDARRWRTEAAESREQLASSRSIIINAVDGTTFSDVAAAKPAAAPVELPQSPIVNPIASAAAIKVDPKPVAGTERAPTTPTSKPAEQLVAANTPETGAQMVSSAAPNRPTTESSTPTIRISNPAPDAKPVSTNAEGPMDVGSLLPYATRRTSPVYPPAARNTRTGGSVRLEVLVDEEGDVVEVHDASGPVILQGAAKDAVRKWKFKPFVRDGQAVKAIGWISFNFNL